MPYKDKERQLAYQREHYRQNKAKHNARRYQQKLRDREVIRELLATAKDVPCADCGVKYPTCVMDFDHVRGTKRFNIGDALDRSPKSVKEEIKKCDVVCSNCHRIRTHLGVAQSG